MKRAAPHGPEVRPAASDTVTVDIDLTAAEAAWKKHEARALAPKEVKPARVDVTVAAAIALAGARNVLAHRDVLVASFCDPPLAVLDRVPEECLAAQHADLLQRAAEDPARLGAVVAARPLKAGLHAAAPERRSGPRVAQPLGVGLRGSHFL